MYYARRAGLGDPPETYTGGGGTGPTPPGPKPGPVQTTVVRSTGPGQVVSTTGARVSVQQAAASYTPPFAPPVVRAQRRQEQAAVDKTQAEQEYAEAKAGRTSLSVQDAFERTNSARLEWLAANAALAREEAAAAAYMRSFSQDDAQKAAADELAQKGAADKAFQQEEGIVAAEQARPPEAKASGPTPDDPRLEYERVRQAQATAKQAFDQTISKAVQAAQTAAAEKKKVMAEKIQGMWPDRPDIARRELDKLDQQFNEALPQIAANAANAAHAEASRAMSAAYVQTMNLQRAAGASTVLEKALKGLFGLGAGTPMSVQAPAGTVQYGGAKLPGTAATGLVQPVPFQGQAGPQGQRDIQASIRNIALRKYGRFDGSMVSDPGTGGGCPADKQFYQGICTTPELARLLQVTEGAPGLPSAIVMGQEVGRGSGYSDIMQRFAERAIMREAGAQTGGGYPVYAQGGSNVTIQQTGGGYPVMPQEAEVIPGGPVEPHEEWFRETPSPAAEAESIETMGGMGRFYYR